MLFDQIRTRLGRIVARIWYIDVLSCNFDATVSVDQFSDVGDHTRFARFAGAFVSGIETVSLQIIAQGNVEATVKVHDEHSWLEAETGSVIRFGRVAAVEDGDAAMQERIENVYMPEKEGAFPYICSLKQKLPHSCLIHSLSLARPLPYSA